MSNHDKRGSMKPGVSLFKTPALLLTMLLLLLACGGLEEAVYVGVIGPETGSYSNFGVETYHGASMAVSAFSKGKFTSEELPLRVIHYDTGGDLELMEEQFRRMVEVDGVAAVIVSDPRPEAVRLAGRLASELDVAVFLAADTLNTTAELDAPNLYNLCPDYHQVIPRVVGIAADWTSADKLALVSSGLPLNQDYLKLFRRELEDRDDLDILELELSLTGYDFESAAYRLLADGYDTFIFNGSRSDLLSLMTVAAEITYLPTFVTLADALPRRLELPENHVLDHGYFIGGFSPFSDDARTTAFTETFRTRVGYLPSYTAAAGYDAARIIIRAINKADSGEAGPVGGAVAALDDHLGVAAEYDLENAPGEVFIERALPAPTGIDIELVEETPLLPPSTTGAAMVEEPVIGTAGREDLPDDAATDEEDTSEPDTDEG